jgi:hypothetical protein
VFSLVSSNHEAVDIMLRYVLGTVLLAVTNVHGIYFYVPTGGAEKCFGEEAYSDAVIHISYKHENQHGVVCTGTIYGLKNVVLFQKPLTDASGSFATVVPKGSPGGQYKICLKCPGSRWTENEPQKFQIKIDVGGRSLLDAGDGFAQADDVRSVEVKARSALDRLASLSMDHEYERVTESMWRDESEKVNSSVQLLSILSIAVVVIVFAVQAISLKRYFKQEKLIF